MQKKTSGAVSGSSAEKAQKNAGSATAKKKPMSLPLFEAGVASILREKGLIPLEGDFRAHWLFEQAVDMFEIECNTSVADYNDAVTAIGAFERWLENTGHVFSKPVSFLVKGWHITLTVPVQSGTVSLGVDFEPLTDDIDKVLQDVKAELAERFNKNWKAPAKQTQQNETGESRKLKAHIVGLRAEEKSNGRIYYYAMPASGPWVTYGIPLYGDVAEAMGLELDQEPGEYEWEADIFYETKGDSDKPKRVIGYAK